MFRHHARVLAMMAIDYGRRPAELRAKPGGGGGGTRAPRSCGAAPAAADQRPSVREFVCESAARPKCDERADASFPFHRQFAPDEEQPSGRAARSVRLRVGAPLAGWLAGWPPACPSAADLHL